MGKGMKAGKVSNKTIYTQSDVKALMKRAEDNANAQLEISRKQMLKDFERAKDITFHNCDLWEQVILFVALKRTFGFGEKRMAKVGLNAQEISDSLKFDQATFNELKAELSEVGYYIEEDLWEWE